MTFAKPARAPERPIWPSLEWQVTWPSPDDAKHSAGVESP